MTWEEIRDSFVQGCVDLAWKLLAALIIFILGKLVITLILKVFFGKKLFKRADPMVKSFMRSFVKAILWIVVWIMIVCTQGVEVASVVTVLASAGAAIALAMQGALSNLASGFLLMIFRPFEQGEFIECAGNTGTVIEVGLSNTTLRKPDNVHVIIPNNILIANPITNYSKEDTRRVDIPLDVAYGTDLQKVKDVILETVSKNEMVLQDPAPFIRLTETKDSSILFTLRVWTAKDNYWPCRFDMVEQCITALQDNGIQIPFPQIDVHMKD